MEAARRRREHGHLARAIAYVGSQTALADALGVSYQALQGWQRRRVPLARCAEVEAITHGSVQCEELREDYQAARGTLRPYQRRTRTGVYVSGPMSGIEQLNRPAFNAEARRLRAAGYHVVNPAEVVLAGAASWHDFMRTDLIQMLEQCSVICLLPGWMDSRGARLEHQLAIGLDFTVVDAGELA